MGSDIGKDEEIGPSEEEASDGTVQGEPDIEAGPETRTGVGRVLQTSLSCPSAGEGTAGSLSRRYREKS